MKNEEVKYSEEFESLINSPPNWFLRSGLGTFLFVLVIFSIASWFIKYPDTIDGEVKVVSTNPRKKIISKAQGRISFFIKENSFVKKNDVIGVIENPTSYDDAFYLMNQLNIGKNDEQVILKDSLDFKNNLNLGEIEAFYLDFLKKQNDFFLFNDLAILERKKSNLSGKLNYQEQLKKNKINQNSISSDKLKLEKNKLERFKTLYEKGVISRADYERAEADYLDITKNIEIEKGNLKEIEAFNYELSGKISELDLEILRDSIFLKNELINSFYQLNNKIEEWNQRYVLRSPNDGLLVYNSFWSDGQFVNINDEVGSIIPNKENIFGIGIILTVQSGKVKKGQKSFIYLDNYPYEEYGVLEAEVKDISPIPQDGTYRVRLNLKNGLNTTNNFSVEFKPELQGRLEIITEDTNVLQRIFYRIKSKMNG